MLIVLFDQVVEICFLFWNLEDPAISIRILVQEATESSVKIRTGSIQWQT